MAPSVLAVRFGVVPAKETMIARLRDELGTEMTEDIAIEWSFVPGRNPSAAYRGDIPGSAVRFESMDVVALVYAKKVSVALGGRPIDLATGEYRSVEIPTWAKVPWTHHNPFRRLRIRQGVITV